MAEPVLSQQLGYFVLLGFSALFAGLVTGMVKLELRHKKAAQTSEWFNTANRTVKTGLVAAAIASAWTWPAGLLVSATIAFNFGISGAFWYAAGAAVQVLLFGVIAIELKRKAPNSHTFLEIIRVRFGNSAHKVFLGFALLTNMIVSAMLVLGGSAVVNSLTGIDIIIAAFLIPLGVMVYTFSGGLKATFIADYFNTAIIFSVVLIFVTTVYIFSDATGGVQGMFDKLTNAANIKPVQGNASGSYLTLASIGGLIFGVINLVGNFGTVFVDQSYWQRAIAAKPSSSVRAFLLGGLAWFAWPFAMAATIGLTVVALGIPITPEQVALGQVAPIAATALLGDLGAVLLLTIIFMALTSTASAEQIAVSSIISYDIYRTYRKPNATGKELLKVTKITILVFGVSMGVLAATLLQAGIGLGYVYLAMGVIIGSAVVPIGLTITWKNTNGRAAIAGALIGLVAGVIIWLGTAQTMFGELTIASTGNDIPLLFGNLGAILIGGFVTFIGSIFRPTNYDWKATKEQITLVDGSERSDDTDQRDLDERYLKKAYKFSIKSGLILSLILLVAWPIPMYVSGYVFDIGFYYFWAALGIGWTMFAIFICVALPIIESRKGIALVFRAATVQEGGSEPTNGAVRKYPEP